MNRWIALFLGGWCTLALPQAIAASLAGEYWAVDEGERLLLRLETRSGEQLSGVLQSGGLSYPLKAERRGSQFTGILEVEGDWFEVSGQLEGDRLHVTLTDPDYEDQETLLFHRQLHAPEGAPPPSHDEGGQGQVVVNGRALAPQQLAALEQTYNVTPRPGQYWYDARSGLYGVVGYPAWGFMLPGHELGQLRSDASHGTSGVFVNGRQLPHSEWVVWSQLLGYLIQPGRYWLDSNGNAGYEGNPVATVNLYQAARQNAYRGGASGGGDNFWSSRFSAGNYDQGNSRGYVSVPGYGPVGYGF